MKLYKMQPFVKYVVLKVNLFESEVIDECNFGVDDTKEMLKFKMKYANRDDCVLVTIQM